MLTKKINSLYIGIKYDGRIYDYEECQQNKLGDWCSA